MTEDENTIVVVGAGTMGAGIAYFFSASGWRTIVVDPSSAARELLVRQQAASIERLGADPARVALIPVARLDDVPWPGTHLVIESIIEDLEAKRACFAELERLSPAHIPLASNSTGFPISRIAEGLATRERMLGAHFLMPAQFVPLVEIIPAETTSPHVVESLRALLAALGKRPVVLNRPLVGFLANRMQSALMREALSLIDRGIASPADIDDAVRYGFGFRYAAAGPILQKEHSGWDISMSLYEKVFPELCNATEPPAGIRALLESGNAGMKTGAGYYDWSDGSKTTAEKLRFETALAAVLAILK